MDDFYLLKILFFGDFLAYELHKKSSPTTSFFNNF